MYHMDILIAMLNKKSKYEISLDWPDQFMDYLIMDSTVVGICIIS
jgi:hypothetical protein